MSKGAQWIRIGSSSVHRTLWHALNRVALKQRRTNAASIEKLMLRDLQLLYAAGYAVVCNPSFSLKYEFAAKMQYRPIEELLEAARTIKACTSDRQ